MTHLQRHAQQRHAPAEGRLLRYRDGKPITYRRYDHLWQRIGAHLPWVATQGISTHWLRHTTLTWVERTFSHAVARAYAGHKCKINSAVAPGRYRRPRRVCSRPLSPSGVYVATLGANLYQLHLAGSRELPKGADVYKTIKSDLEAASSHPDMGMWWDAMEATTAVFGWAETNLRDAGQALCLIAYELADTDQAAKQELLRSAGMSELPPHGDDQWLAI